MPIRKIPLAKDEVYHVYNKSIAGFKIFNDCEDCDRMIELISFHAAGEVPCSFSTHKKCFWADRYSRWCRRKCVCRGRFGPWRAHSISL